ncbi:hypothetical protein [Streptomyces sp. NPDC015350]|uniref:hypothetical protein n=1 Tax=Streptomyces sp. NPDC015350 TaxID=3364955 RepID=UPI003702288D
MGTYILNVGFSGDLRVHWQQVGMAPEFLFERLVGVVSSGLSVEPIMHEDHPYFCGANFESEDFFVQVIVDGGENPGWPYRMVPGYVRILPRGEHEEDYFAKRIYDEFIANGEYFVLLEEEDAGVFISSNFADSL